MAWWRRSRVESEDPNARAAEEKDEEEKEGALVRCEGGTKVTTFDAIIRSRSIVYARDCGDEGAKMVEAVLRTNVEAFFAGDEPVVDHGGERSLDLVDFKKDLEKEIPFEPEKEDLPREKSLCRFIFPVRRRGHDLPVRRSIQCRRHWR